MNFRDTYQDKKILITGGLGFVGSNLAHTLLEIGAQVTTLDIADPESGANPFNLDGIKSQVRVIEADIRDGQMLREAVEGQDIIFNLAGEMSHIGSMTDPFKDLNVNTVGQFNPFGNVPIAQPRRTHCLCRNPAGIWARHIFACG